MKKRINPILYFCLIISIYAVSFSVYAEQDPITQTAKYFYTTLFGLLGTCIACIIVGASFILAYVNKITWDRFIYIGVCVGGFIGTPSIIGLIKGVVN